MKPARKLILLYALLVLFLILALAACGKPGGTASGPPPGSPELADSTNKPDAGSAPAGPNPSGAAVNPPGAHGQPGPSNQPTRGRTQAGRGFEISGTYTVRSGDTISDIAQRFGTTTATLLRVNGLTSSVIRPGQVLKIAPGGPAPTPPPQGGDAAPPVKTDKPLAGKVIVIDPGHGGPPENGGSTGVTGVKEKDINLALGLALRDTIQRAGARVTMTRTTDAAPHVPGDGGDHLEAVTTIARNSGADLFVSLHGNWNPDPSINGIEAYYFPGDSTDERVATVLLKNVVAATGMRDNGVRSERYYVLYHHDVPAALMEIGYLSNPGDEAHLKSSSFRGKIVSGLYHGILEYFKSR